jgi:hypothetical protein
MIKKKVNEIFTYKPKVKLTIDDILEIYQSFKHVFKKTTIEVNNFELEAISEIFQVKPPFTELKIFGDNDDGFNMFLIHGDYIKLNLNDSDNVLMIGLRSYIETIINNRENPMKKESILNHTSQYEPDSTSAIETMKNTPIDNVTQNDGESMKKESRNDSYLAGITTLIITFFCALISIQPNIWGTISGNFMVGLALIFGVLTGGSFVFPETVGPIVVELLKRINTNAKKQRASNEDNKTIVIQQFGPVSGDINQNIGSKNSQIKKNREK